MDGAWECGISEVRYPLTFFNILDDATLIKAQNTVRQHTLHFSPGFYTTADVIKKISSFISEDHAEGKVDNHSEKISVTTGNHSVYMSLALYDFLGHYFEPKNKNRVFERLSSYEGQRVVDSHRSLSTVIC